MDLGCVFSHVVHCQLRLSHEDLHVIMKCCTTRLEGGKGGFSCRVFRRSAGVRTIYSKYNVGELACSTVECMHARYLTYAYDSS